ncbi:MAG: divergent polysaccharide deacetylase family protein [Epsilonproteobacteria bacterium]|nr:divergent polysaccharide deacetylase family protein [Campylobacterota bacterium]
MGKSLFIKILILLLLTILTFVGLEYYNTSQLPSKTVPLIEKSVKTTSKQILSDEKSKEREVIAYEENKTLDNAYQSVASQIKTFQSRLQASDENKTVAITKVLDDANLTLKVTKEPVLTSEIKKVSKQSVKQKETKLPRKVPKLAIIMDDIGFCYQADSIKRLPFPVTPSIFPPNNHYPHTPKIAKRFKYHMVHFPMEAYKYKNIKENAVKISDSAKSIEDRIEIVKKSFPHALAINNHTGSKFTCDLNAMERFFKILKKYNIPFLDSRTAAETKCMQAAKIVDKHILQRDVFLDNVADVDYIHGQLKSAVTLAKKNGQAIAICHPKELTFEALMKAEKILEGVELVYINELM